MLTLFSLSTDLLSCIYLLDLIFICNVVYLLLSEKTPKTKVVACYIIALIPYIQLIFTAVLCLSLLRQCAKRTELNSNQTFKLQACYFFGKWMLPFLLICLIAIFFHKSDANIFNMLLLTSEIFLIFLIIMYWLTVKSLLRTDIISNQTKAMPWLVAMLYRVGLVFFSLYLLDTIIDRIHGFFVSGSVSYNLFVVMILVIVVVTPIILATLCMVCLTWIKKQRRWSRVILTLSALLFIINVGFNNMAMSIAYHKPYLYACIFLLLLYFVIFIISMAWHKQTTRYIKGKCIS